MKLRELILQETYDPRERRPRHRVEHPHRGSSALRSARLDHPERQAADSPNTTADPPLGQLALWLAGWCGDGQTVVYVARNLARARATATAVAALAPEVGIPALSALGLPSLRSGPAVGGGHGPANGRPAALGRTPARTSVDDHGGRPDSAGAAGRHAVRRRVDHHRGPSVAARPARGVPHQQRLRARRACRRAGGGGAARQRDRPVSGRRRPSGPGRARRGPGDLDPDLRSAEPAEPGRDRPARTGSRPRGARRRGPARGPRSARAAFVLPRTLHAARLRAAGAGGPRSGGHSPFRGADGAGGGRVRGAPSLATQRSRQRRCPPSG